MSAFGDVHCRERLYKCYFELRKFHLPEGKFFPYVIKCTPFAKITGREVVTD